ncbi:MAG: DNA/RNA non-specific endonuclease [Anaerovoracaceae bacterium]|nr:DNA/RNA non-specific endonuclease [Bacillota bacterium]MEE0516700.1 DNA/RNA non-specific endonuclease [Anaerovoracaceae bacterium]
MKKTLRIIAALLLTVAFAAVTGCSGGENAELSVEYRSLADLPKYCGEPYVELNGNIPEFDDEDMKKESFEIYSEFDDKGRCGVAYAKIGRELMPDEDRESIGQIKPSGWHTVRYDDIIKDKYLYNRCHLIGFQLAGENANEKNLITGTRYMNVDGMLPFENEVAEYVRTTGNHVMYRVTPVYDGDDLLAKGVVMEAYSVEDEGEGVSFNVFVYNVQPGINIDYATGESSRAEEEIQESDDKDQDSNLIEQGDQLYVLNVNSKKFHLPDCSSVKKIKPENREETKTSRSSLINMGFEPCGNCNP